MKSIYPSLDLPPEEMARAAREKPDPHAFRLRKINELEAFLRSEIESRGRLHKKYHRAAKMLDCSFDGLAGAGMGMGAGGFTYIIQSRLSGLSPTAAPRHIHLYVRFCNVYGLSWMFAVIPCKVEQDTPVIA